VEVVAFIRAARLLKTAAVFTPLKSHQQRVVDRIQQEDQPGLVVAHGLGSGKTLTSIAAQEALGMDSDVVVPASLQANYRKELKKHTKGEHKKTNILSMQNVARKRLPPNAPLMIVDEAHRARDAGTRTFGTLSKNTSKKRLLLTGSPFYNRPADIAPLVNMAAGKTVLPNDQQEFADKYIYQLKQNPGLLARVRGVKGGSTPILHPGRKADLKKALNKWVDYHEGSKEGFPSVSTQDVKVPMVDQQLDVYDTLMKKAPFWVRYKVRHGLPPTKQEAGDLNAFLGGARQVANTTAPFQTDEPSYSPKIEKAVAELRRELDSNPRSKAVVYSNYLDAGINPYKERLQKAGIPFGEFTGAMKKKDRDALVKSYNEDKIRALLLSSAGGEGLDLKGTRLMQVLEPHWNNEKLRQVEGRGIRYGSHAHLPQEEQNVRVQRFLSTRPKKGILERVGVRSPGLSVDEYLTRMSQDKERLNYQFRDLLKRDQAAQ
jgi:SNF2 family DNA or RNA helicase